MLRFISKSGATGKLNQRERLAEKRLKRMGKKQKQNDELDQSPVKYILKITIPAAILITALFIGLYFAVSMISSADSSGPWWRISSESTGAAVPVTARAKDTGCHVYKIADHLDLPANAVT